MNQYIKSLLEKSCYEELHPLFVRTSNPTKEITESYSPFHIFSKLNIKLDDKLIYHIGDGSKCTTGALFAFLSKSINISIDPVINEKIIIDWIKKYKVERFNFYKGYWQNFPLNENPNIIVCIHSHINLEDLDQKYPYWDYLYSSPCCEWENQTFSTDYMIKHNIETIIAGTDKNITSPKNKIFLYSKIKK